LKLAEALRVGRVSNIEHVYVLRVIARGADVEPVAYQNRARHQTVDLDVRENARIGRVRAVDDGDLAPARKKHERVSARGLHARASAPFSG
jgi:hypothetical protein